MGRLFWKFFFAFWLALVLAGIGVGTAVWLHNRGEAAERDARPLLGGPRAGFFLDVAAATLRHGGTAALRDALEDSAARSPERNPAGAMLLVVDEAGRDLLGRPVPEALLDYARGQAAERDSDEIRAVASEGHDYLLFVATDPARQPLSPRLRHRTEPPPPWLPVLAGIVASLAFSALLAWYLSKPVRHLRRAFGEVEAGHLETRVAPLMGGRRDEIADLGSDFDTHGAEAAGGDRRPAPPAA